MGGLIFLPEIPDVAWSLSISLSMFLKLLKHCSASSRAGEIIVVLALFDGPPFIYLSPLTVLQVVSAPYYFYYPIRLPIRL
jgi:hypothetical protein